MRAAWFLARGVLPDYFSKFSRHDFTVPQLFACLIVKEQQRKPYRDIEALLRDARRTGAATSACAKCRTTTRCAARFTR